MFHAVGGMGGRCDIWVTLVAAAAWALPIARARAEVLDVATPAVDYTTQGALDTVSGVRPSLRGTLARPWLRFESEAELAQSSPSVLSGYLEIQPLDEIGRRIGREDTSPSRRDEEAPAQLLLPEGDRLADYFSPDHQEGITAFGSLGSDLLEYSGGLYAAGAGYVGDARLAVSPLSGGDADDPPDAAGSRTVCTLGL